MVNVYGRKWYIQVIWLRCMHFLLNLINYCVEIEMEQRREKKKFLFFVNYFCTSFRHTIQLLETHEIDMWTLQQKKKNIDIFIECNMIRVLTSENISLLTLMCLFCYKSYKSKILSQWKKLFSEQNNTYGSSVGDNFALEILFQASEMNKFVKK